MIVALFYYVQFGLMLSDAAYGLIMVAGTAYCLTKFKNMEAGMKKFMKMFMYCGISTTFWGFMFGSFFGDAVNVIATTFFNRPDIRLAPLWFEPVKPSYEASGICVPDLVFFTFSLDLESNSTPV